MKKVCLVLMLMLMANVARADGNDPAFLQRAIVAIQAQRNSALDQAAAQQARADGLQEELTKAKARIDEFEKKPEQPK